MQQSYDPVGPAIDTIASGPRVCRAKNIQWLVEVSMADAATGSNIEDRLT